MHPALRRFLNRCRHSTYAGNGNAHSPLSLRAHGITPNIVHAYAREINRIIALPEVKDRLTGLGYQMMSATPAEFGAMVKRDAARFRKIIIESKMQQLEYSRSHENRHVVTICLY